MKRSNMKKKTDYDKAMDKAIDGSVKLASSIAKNDSCMTPQIGVSIQILVQELLFTGYTKKLCKEICDKAISLAEKEVNIINKKSKKKAA